MSATFRKRKAKTQRVPFRRPRPFKIRTTEPIAFPMFLEQRKQARLRRRNIRTAGFLGIEHKFIDTSLVSSALTAPTDSTGGEHDPATVLCLNAVAQGDGEEQRDGKAYVIDQLYMNGFVQFTNQANQTAVDVSPSYFGLS